MSNAAVVKLNRKKLPGKEIWLDDNFAESIHIHLNDFRCDLTRNNFIELYDEIADAINELICIEGFDIRGIDPVFFQQSLHSNLSYLREVKIDMIKLSELWIYDGRLRPLKESHVMKGLEGDEKAGNLKRKSDLKTQSGMERIQEIDNSIKKNGYPMDGKYIIVYNDDLVIRDGQHRACSLMKAYGDIEIPIMRLFFSNYDSIDVGNRAKLSGELAYRISTFWKRFKRSRGLKANVSKLFVMMKSNVKNIARKIRRKLYIQRNNKVIAEATKVLESK